MSMHATDLTIRKSVVVEVPPEQAFALFTREVSTWWPLATHSFGGEAAVEAVFEEREGGRFYERQRDGTEGEWATVQAWEPPHRFVLEWTVDRRRRTEVEVRFRAEGTGTRVELEHRGWEGYGDEAEPIRGDYDGGWDVVLGRYEKSATR